MDDVEKVKQKIDIVEIISEYIPVKRAGRNFKALCPFHSEKSPSFVISPERGIWHCFGCQKGGDVFTFIIEYEKITFSEALKFLAERTGIKLESPAFRSENEKKRDKIYSANNIASTFYNYILLSHPAGKNALSYLLDERKISLELIKKFNLGFAPNNPSALSSYLTQKKSFSKDDLILSGIATLRGSKLYDFFTKRIIFPLHDTRGNTIAFSGRTISSQLNSPKYINTRETLIYTKGDTLYGIYFAKESIKKEGKAILVEGEFDVISAFREGITNIVAVKGTALTQNQIKLLKRYTENISFCFDTDKAGENAQLRSIKLIEEAGLTAKVIIPPEGKDPDELLKTNPVIFKKALKKEVHMFDYIIDSAVNNSKSSSVDDKKLILDKTLPYFALIENEVIKEHYLKKLANILDASYESVIKQIEKISTDSKIQKKPQITKNARSREEVLEMYFLALVTQAKNVKEAIARSVNVLSDIHLTFPLYDRIFNHLKESFDEDDFKIEEFTKDLPTELIDGFDKCYLYPISVFETEELYYKELEKMAIQLRNLVLRQKLKLLSDKIKQTEKEKDEELLAKLHQDFDDLTKTLQSSSGIKLNNTAISSKIE